ncbi:esterase-like activity of phytase family protein [Sphingomonas sp. ac-8]|uniref:esterase-like activity of phytase family protein n=1 Tax=Sphingomonas sp. ac-8 TaxID=3242977 RepID=UPI003A7F8B43
MRIVSVVLLTLALVPSWTGTVPRQVLGKHADVAATPVPLRAGDPANRRLGALTYLGGVRLTSRDPAFGGFSAMRVEGDRVTLLSDYGSVVRFRIDGKWRVSAPEFLTLPGGPGTGWEKRDRDSESLAVDPATGQLWVGFERANAIWRYSADFARVERHVVPKAMAKWPSAKGAEAMVRLRSGAFLVFSEGAGKGRPGRGLDAIRFEGDATEHPDRGFHFRYLPPSGTSPTDVVELADGRLIVLHRAASLGEGFTAIVSLVDARAIRPGALVEGRQIARLAGEVIHDNYEALAVTYENDAPILWIASDDNQMWFEQSLLLKFRLDLPPEGGR